MMRRKHVVITAGPTRAYLDEVRFLSNFSSGELGYLICQALKERGVLVTAVVGPTRFAFETLGLKKVHAVETNGEMQAAVLKTLRQQKTDWIIFSAAVLDFVPRKTQKGKISSSLKQWKVDLVPAPKIIDAVCKEFPRLKKTGFKLESKKSSGAAQAKFAQALIEKRDLESLVLNFRSEVKNTSHQASIYKKGVPTPKRFSTKKAIAKYLADQIVSD